MRTKTLLFILLIITNSCLICVAQANSCGNANEVIKDINDSILNEDVQKFIFYIGEGIWNDDVPTMRNKALPLLKNKKSRLYKFIFVEHDSLKALLSQDTTEIKQHDIQIETPSWKVMLCTKNSNAPCQSYTIMCVNGKWNLTNINSY